jgi:4-amino-4-deoxy-L-arabinose transferase-like glycosyltransferase
MIEERRLRPALGAIVLLVGLAVAVFAVYPHPEWMPDGYAYAVRMLMDAGYPFQDAIHRAQEFYWQQPIAADPVQAQVFRGEQEPLYWGVFKPRVVYPYIASLLYPFRGFYGMLDISVVAYVLASLTVYYLALQFAAALPSLAVTLGFMAFPMTVHLARYPQTDMLGLLLSTVCILALVRVARGGGWKWPAVFALSGLLLMFTRPAFYLLLGGAIGLWIGVRRSDPAARRASVFCIAAALVCTLLYLWAALATGTPSFSYVIEDAREIFFATQDPNAPHRSLLAGFKVVLHFTPDDRLSVWYAKMIVDLIFRELVRSVAWVFPVIGIFGLATLRRDRAFWALVLSALALCLVMPLDPISLDMNRVLEVPMLPILAVGVAAAWALFAQRFIPSNPRLAGKTLKKTSPGG